MSNLLENIGYFVLGCFGLAIALILGWFIVAMGLCFYKIYIKKKSKNKQPEVVIRECYKGHGLCNCLGTCLENSN